MTDQVDKYMKLAKWQEAITAAIAAKQIIEAEQKLRKEVMAMFFPEPAEGVNTLELNAGWKLKGTHKIERKIDEAALDATRAKLREMGVNPDPLVRLKPELDTKAYKSLKTINAEAAKVFDEALLIKPGSPTLELVAPKTE